MMNRGGSGHSDHSEILLGLAFLQLQADPEGFKARVAEYTAAKDAALAAKDAASIEMAEAEKIKTEAAASATELAESRRLMAEETKALNQTRRLWTAHVEAAEIEMKQRQDALSRAETKAAETASIGEQNLVMRRNEIKTREDEFAAQQADLSALITKAKDDAAEAARLMEEARAVRAAVIAAVP